MKQTDLISKPNMFESLRLTETSQTHTAEQSRNIIRPTCSRSRLSPMSVDAGSREFLMIYELCRRAMVDSKLPSHLYFYKGHLSGILNCP